MYKRQGDKECEEKFKEAQEAYAVLSDAEKRKQYDQFGHAAFDGTGGGAGGFDFSGMDMGDIFGDIFGDFFGGGSRRRTNDGPMKGSNLRTSVRITFEEAIFGCEKEIEMVLKDECHTCLSLIHISLWMPMRITMRIAGKRSTIHSSMRCGRVRMTWIRSAVCCSRA